MGIRQRAGWPRATGTVEQDAMLNCICVFRCVTRTGACSRCAKMSRHQVDEEVRSKLAALEVGHQNEIQRTVSAFARLQKYAESRKR
ncbi:hypothetical protein SETIT_4G203200v2 [Setaria italica]|uniref:Uncharacterized protein n=1 Tax=Setaria italica TaxID=4555 RepID=A0A368QW77_SETIT|nr:hypothetical protein SETIT_4G203200v2 [Setaria italica]